jgi:SpoIID/LytB domain protein
VGLTGTGLAALNPTLKVGTVQRFGAQPTDRLTIKATPGDRLKLMFKTQKQLQTLNVDSIELEVKPQSLAQPRLEERVVLSTHRSFETTEASAAYWREQGIAVEVAQPERWQVWAKRDQYNTPLLRRLLLQSLQEKGVNSAFLDSQVLQQVPRASWVVNGYRYNRDVLSIYASKNLIQVNQKLYAGSLRLQPNAYGNYTLVNQVPIETYLRGVVPHEIGRNAPEPAIQAQAIIARTYALRNLRRFAIDGYELCADTQCQVYEGLNGTDPVSDRAIAATADQVLTYNNELVDALYSSATGGVTAPFQDVWQGSERPYLTTIIDAVPNQVWDLSRQSLANEQNFRAFISLDQGFNEAEWPQFRWRVETTLAEMTQTLQTYLQNQKSPMAGFKTIQQVQVVERSQAGRVLKIRVQTDRGLIELVKDDILRGFDPPRSLLFYLEPLYLPDGKTLKGYAFVGGGLGHGVGLSQTGSYRLGRLGWSAAQILSFYYPGTQTQRLSQSIVFWQEKPASQGQSTTSTPDPVKGVKAPPAELRR